VAPVTARRIDTMDDERAEYLRAVEQRFVALRGRGLMLSARDVALVERWRTDGVPLRIVLRALEEGVRNFVDRNVSGTPLPSALAYYESQVDKTALLWRERTMSWSTGSAEVAPEAAAERRVSLIDGALAAISEAGQRIEAPAIKAVLRDVWRSLRQSADQSGEEPWALIARLDGDMVERVEATLEQETRAALRARAEAHVDARAGGAMSPGAREARVGQVMAAEVREHVGLPDLVQVVSHVDL